MAEQAIYYVEAFTSALQEFSLPDISTLEFAWIDVAESCQKSITKVAAKQSVKVKFGSRNPAEKLDTDELLVLSYA